MIGEPPPSFVTTISFFPVKDERDDVNDPSKSCAIKRDKHKKEEAKVSKVTARVDLHFLALKI